MVKTLTVYEPKQEYVKGVPITDELKNAMDKFCNDVNKQYEEWKANEPVETPSEAPAELTPEQQIDAYKRKEQTLREAQTELVNLEDQMAELRKEVNGYKKPIADARAKVQRLISCDISGFLQWEKEQELPLLQRAEEAANAWRKESVEKLDVTEKDKEKLLQHFVTCGNVADWLCKDFPEGKPGLNGEATKDRLRNAIQKISGITGDGDKSPE